MAKNLLIVESPAKARTIEKFLGKDYKVTSCYGHIRDLQKGDKAINVKKKYEPTYVIPEDKKKIVDELKKLAKNAEEIFLATDEDREGEAISWHLCEVLNIKPKSAKRIVFHEITKTAILHAIKNPRGLNIDLVNAQQARRILDRLVGFELSPILWRKISLKNSLSAGRVQSVAVRLIVEREREINSFQTASQYKVTAEFNLKNADGKNIILKAELPERFNTEKEAQAFLEKCAGQKFSVADIQVKPGKRSPSAPFTTSTLQQEASRKLYFSISKTMMMAQKLYESGFITYMRTDSVNLSELALDAAEKEINMSFGKKYHQHRVYKTKTANAQEAHEAIRPTDMSVSEVDASEDEKRLYSLIWKRTIASQMSDAEIEKTIARISISNVDKQLTATGEVLKFDGFLKVYMESTDEETDEENSSMLPPLTVGQVLDLKELSATERFSRPPSRYTEASLVKKLEELGIGRPSTYAPTISTVQKRGYVIKKDKEGVERKYVQLVLSEDKISRKKNSEITGADKSKLFPTDVGSVVNDFLVQHFAKVLDFGFTAEIEKEFDEIATGDRVWADVIDEFYKPFHKTVEVAMETSERVTGERLLGTDPESGKPVYSKVGRYGPMVQIGDMSDEVKPRFAKLRPNQNIETITFEEALILFNLPRILGEFEGKEVKISEGRFGPYALHDGKFYSLKKDQDPYTINFEDASELIAIKREELLNKTIREFSAEGIQILRGQYGPYIKQGKKNVRIPKSIEPEKLTLEECVEMIAKAPEKKKGFRRRKSA